MAGSPRFKVHDQNGVYQASCKEIEAAAALVSFYGERARIRDAATNTQVWVEGAEYDGLAGASYDYVAELAWERIRIRIAVRHDEHRRRQAAYAAQIAAESR